MGIFPYKPSSYWGFPIYGTPQPCLATKRRTRGRSIKLPLQRCAVLWLTISSLDVRCSLLLAKATYKEDQPGLFPRKAVLDYHRKNPGYGWSMMVNSMMQLDSSCCHNKAIYFRRCRQHFLLVLPHATIPLNNLSIF